MFDDYYVDCRNSWAEESSFTGPDSVGLLWKASSVSPGPHAYLPVSRATFHDVLHRLGIEGRKQCLYEYASDQYEINFGWMALRLDPAETDPDDRPMFLVEEPMLPREG